MLVYADQLSTTSKDIKALPLPKKVQVQHLQHQIQTLSAQRDEFVTQKNSTILAHAKALGQLLNKKISVSLGKFNTRQMNAIPYQLNKSWEYTTYKRGQKGVVIVPEIIHEGQKHLVFVIDKIPFLNNASRISFPAGFIGDAKEHEQESPKAAAERELLEETGFRSDKISVSQPLTPDNASKGDLYFAVAKDLHIMDRWDRRSEGEKSMELRTELVPVAKVNKWLESKQKAGFQIDSRVPSGLYYYFKHQKESE